MATMTTGKPELADALAEIADQWDAWYRQQRAAAHAATAAGEEFDATLKNARADVRRRAAGLLRDLADRARAAEQMMRHAAAVAVPYPPLVDYDRVAVAYTRARAWQHCARMLNPDLAEVQPRWPDSH